MIGTSIPARARGGRSSKKTRLSKNSCVIRKARRRPPSSSGRRGRRQVGASGWTSGKQAPPIAKSWRSEMRAASSGDEDSPPSGCSNSVSPRGGSPRRASTFSSPAALDARRGSPRVARRLSDAAQVRHRLDPELALDRARDLDRALPRRPAGAVGHRDEAGVERLQRADRLVQRLDALGVLGGKNSNENTGRVVAMISSIRMVG